MKLSNILAKFNFKQVTFTIYFVVTVGGDEPTQIENRKLHSECLLHVLKINTIQCYKHTMKAKKSVSKHLKVIIHSYNKWICGNYREKITALQPYFRGKNIYKTCNPVLLSAAKCKCKTCILNDICMCIVSLVSATIPQPRVWWWLWGWSHNNNRCLHDHQLHSTLIL